MDPADLAKQILSVENREPKKCSPNYLFSPNLFFLFLPYLLVGFHFSLDCARSDWGDSITLDRRPKIANIIKYSCVAIRVCCHGCGLWLRVTFSAFSNCRDELSRQPGIKQGCTRLTPPRSGGVRRRPFKRVADFPLREQRKSRFGRQEK